MKLHSFLFSVLLIVFGLQSSNLFLINGVYSALSMVGLAVVLILLFSTSPTCFFSFLKTKYVSFILFLIILQTIILLAILGLGGRNLLSYSRDVFMCLIFVLLGYTYAFNNVNLYKFFKLNIWIVCLAALSIIIFVAGGFRIQELYFSIPKNQFGPYFVQSILLTFYLLIPTKNNPIVKKNILFYFLMIPCILVLLVMRTRTAMLGLALLFIIFIFYYTSNVKSKMTYLFIAIIAIMLSIETIYNAFFLNFDTSSADSVTAGRTDVYMEALKVIDRYPLTGRLFTNIEITQNSISEQIHNYLLSIYFELGVFSFGFLIIYFSVLFYSAWRVFKYKLISNLLILLLFFVSLSEYTFPYAPGTTTFLPFFLLGYEILKPIRNE